MKAAKKIAECPCGSTTELACEGCGKTVCSACLTREICSFDPKNIVVKHFCPECSRDPKKNTWGTLYWKELVSLFG